MKPLRVLVIVKNGPLSFDREIRLRGFFSYPVPEFTWDFAAQGPANAGTLNGKYDLVAYEDGSEKQAIVSGFPTICFVIDSTLSEAHYQVRAQRAKQAGVVLVDHDDLSEFTGKVYRFPYCVNDHLFRGYGEDKTIDVSFHCGSDLERAKLRRKLGAFCAINGYSYKSGILPNVEYARSMARSKVIANWPRTLTNRPHRIFDALACGAALVTGRVPNIAEDGLMPGRDYIAVDTQDELLAEVKRLLDTGVWKEIAEAGHRVVMERHTWTVRARQLRQIIAQELKL